MDKFHEECAVFGVSMRIEEAAGVVYNGLLALQHRGQEGAGIAVLTDGSIECVKDAGLVGEVFSERKAVGLPKGKVAVGHTRYSTTGEPGKRNIQPFVTEYLKGRIATAHNGNVYNAAGLRESLRKSGINFIASSDSEVVSALTAYETLNADGDAVRGVVNAANRLRGAFSLIIMCGDGKLIAVRDPNGFRPLCIGENQFGMAAASESCALDSCGFEFVRDVEPGEVVVIEDGEIVYSANVLKSDRRGLCVFEFVYFARQDSVIDGQSVYAARVNMGRALARESRVAADVVCGVPDSGIEAAVGYAAESGIPHAAAFVKNRYIGRSFIFPTQSQRENAVKLKLNPLRNNVEGKRVVLVDDSIVRGTTSAKIIAALRAVGATEVHMRVSSPPFRHACYFGTDIDSADKLIANNMSTDDICRKIGADSLAYISEEGLIEACGDCRMPFCTGCFSGTYGVIQA